MWVPLSGGNTDKIQRNETVFALCLLALTLIGQLTYSVAAIALRGE